jgi:diacylglycerol kinase family enzyme
MSSSVAVIINRRSGVRPRVDSNPDGLGRLAQVFKNQGLTPDFLVANRGSDVPKLARKAANRDYGIVVAGGGDGTMNAVASALLGTDKTMGVLPMGTLNHFARDLKIPLALDEAIAVIGEGEPALIDVAEVNGNIFVNNSSLGLYPALVRYRIDNQKMGYSKWAALAKALPTVLRRYSNFNIRLKTRDHRDFQGRTPFVFIGNNEYQLEGTNFGRRNNMADGQLCLFVANEVSRVGLIRLAVQALFGRLREATDFTALTTTEILIETRRRRLSVAIDGEVMPMDSPLHYRVNRSALTVMVPRTTVPSAEASVSVKSYA